MGSRRLSFSLIFGIVATPIIAAHVTTDNIQKRTEGSVKETAIGNMQTPKYYSPLVDLLSPSPWDLNVPGRLSDTEHVIYLRSPRQTDYNESNEDLETAEQILFRPLFRHRQLIAERVQRLKEKEAFRRRIFSSEASPQFASNNFNGIEDRFFNSRK